MTWLIILIIVKIFVDSAVYCYTPNIQRNSASLRKTSNIRVTSSKDADSGRQAASCRNNTPTIVHVYSVVHWMQCDDVPESLTQLFYIRTDPKTMP
jgi:hypothetical protein